MRNLSKTALVFLPLALALLALAGCVESPVLEPGAGGPATSRAVSAAPSRAASPTRPAGGTCTLVRVAVLSPLPGQPANVVRRQAEWLCQLQHLGRTTVTATEAGTATPSGPTLIGAAIYTAANGDQLFTTYSGTATFPNQNGIVTVSATETVTGGTGRFAGASGSLRRVGSVSVILLNGQLELTGTLSY